MQFNKAQNYSSWIGIAVLSLVGCVVAGGVVVSVIALLGILNSDRGKLVALYEATDGDNWKDNTNWLGDSPVEEWKGVTTDSDGRVTVLSLENNRLNGEMPEELGSLGPPGSAVAQ